MKTHTKLLITLCLYPMTAMIVLAELCEDIVGPEAVDVASEVGFQFKVEKISELGHCHKLIKGNTVLLLSEDNDQPVICEATFFGSMDLQGDWKIERSPKFKGNFEYTADGSPKFGTNQADFTIRVESNEVNSLLELVSISLEGPDCENWKQAFNGSGE